MIHWQPVAPKDWVNVTGRITTKSLKACETNSWSLVSVGRDAAGCPDPSKGIDFAPFRCGSWRCRVCGPKVGACDFVRVAAAVASRPRWYYAVLTFDPSDWEDRWDAFQGFYLLWRDRLRKRLARLGGGVGKLEYTMTFERHASGWPHVNVLMAMPGLDLLTDARGVEVRRAGKARDGRLCRLPKWRPDFVRAAKAAGLGGRALWLEEVADGAAVASYLSKTALELVGGGQKGQTPYGAPKGFRRLRATRGTLPPTLKSIRRASGELAARAWAMTNRYSVADWASMPREEFKTRALRVFLGSCADREVELFKERITDRKALFDIERALRGEVDWSNLQTVWAQDIEEIKQWNANSRLTSKGNGG